MSRSQYAPVADYLGAGNLASYTFDFKITNLSQLLVLVADTTGAEVERVRGDDTTYLSSVTFDANNGGGTVNLLANLPTNYRILIMLANDAPTQDFLFRNQGSFKLRDIENALDELAGDIQRLNYLVDRSVKLHEFDSIDPVDLTYFNPNFPPKVQGSVSLIPNTNAAGNGWDNPANWTKVADLAAAIAAAAAAATSASQAATSAAAAAASAVLAAVYAGRAAVVGLASGISTGSVAYSSPLVGATVPKVSIINVIDANPIFLSVIITAFSDTGFSFALSAPTDTVNYQISYQTSGVI